MRAKYSQLPPFLIGSNEEVYSGAYFSPENMKHEQLLAIYNIIVSFDGEQKSIESRESILTKVADRFSSELVAALPRDYFNDLVRKKWGAVQRGQTRKKSVKKFFNQKVSGLDIEQQLGTMMMDEEDADVENIIASLLDELEGVSQAQIPQEKFEKRLVSKITRLRKLDKLKSALGIGSPRSISTASSDTNLAIKLAAPSASISASNSISDLDKDEKKNFFRQSKKLQHVLGESLTEEAVKQLIGSSRKNLSKLASDSDLRLSASNDLFQQRTSAADMASTDRNEIVSDDDYDSGDDDIEKADIRKKQLNKLKYVLGENIANFSQLPCISKLSSVFGERISMDELESSASSLLKEGGGGQGFTENTPSDLPRPLNAEERRMLQKRLAKIEYLLGRPPREELATQEYLVLHNNSGQNVEPSVIEASEISESYELNTWDHRKRMHDKLFDLLGERVPVNDFGDIGLEAGENDDEIISAPPPRPLTTQEKKRLQKRLNKLEQLQGKIPNSADLANQHSSPSSSHSFKKQLESPPASPEIRQQPLTMEEKRSIQKRSNKIEQMLGAVPPASMLKPSKSKADEDLSIISVISAAESSDYDVDVKEIKMKRREKLVNILGEILPKEVFNSTFHLESSEHGAFEIDGSQGKGELHEAVALSPDEKRALQKRLYKIEQVKVICFGPCNQLTHLSSFLISCLVTNPQLSSS